MSRLRGLTTQAFCLFWIILISLFLYSFLPLAFQIVVAPCPDYIHHCLKEVRLFFALLTSRDFIDIGTMASIVAIKLRYIAIRVRLCLFDNYAVEVAQRRVAFRLLRIDYLCCLPKV